MADDNQSTASRPCAACGAPVPPNRGALAVLCGSAACRRTRATESARRCRARAKIGDPTATATAACVTCGADLVRPANNRRAHYCSPCRAAARAAASARYKATHPESSWAKWKAGQDPGEYRRKRTEAAREWRGANREKLRAVYRRARLKKAFGLTVAQYEAMLSAQGGGCAICEATKAGGRGRFHVDHDHATGKVRGLLCHHCNLGVGHFRDDPARLEGALRYVLTRAAGGMLSVVR